MNSLKGFYLQNKKLIMLTASVVIGIFLIFTVIAVIIGSKGDSDNGETTKKLVSEETADNTDNEENTTTDDDSVAHQDETTEEPETEPEKEPETVNPNTLPYKIMVNRAANCITVYGKDDGGQFTVPVKAITCSTGKNVGDTPSGLFTTLVSYNWLLMVDGSYGQYAYRFYGPILFHSVPYFSKNKGDLEWEQYNKLGSPASLGCVRVTVADAIWLITNCQIGTYVEVYDDADNPGPLGKPETIKIPADSPYKGWDPTDPDSANPWHNFKPEIKVKNTAVTVTRGSSISQLINALGAQAYDTCGNNITAKLSITSVDLNKSGTYTAVKLNVTDVINKTASEVTVSVTVKEPESSTQPHTTQPPETEKQTEQKPSEETSPTTSEETEDTSTEEETTTPSSQEEGTTPPKNSGEGGAD